MSYDITLLDEDHDILLEAIEGIATRDSESFAPAEVCHLEIPENTVGHLYLGEEAPGFDVSAGHTWKYPVDYPKRDYQFNIIQNALYQNTLVCLPTGMGKTFIAAVLMYNFYRWYPQGKVIFMAPTKPLVHQQVNACANFTGLPKDSVTIMTGNIKRELRAKEWEEKRVIFCTPQILINDISNNICHAREFKCIVVDEAHKATGNHAYVQVIKQLRSKSATFRVLALSATPGNNFNAIQEVISNLQISHIEARTETSPDVAQYTHKRNIETVIVKISGYLKIVLDKFMNIIEIYARPLIQNGLLSGTVRSLAKYKVFKAWEYVRSHPPQHISPHQLAAANADFAASVSLFHALELLTLHGLRSFIRFINGILKEGKSQPLVKTKLSKCDALISLIEEVEKGLGEELELKMLDPNLPASSQNRQKALPSHPKFEKLEELLKEHFCINANKNSDSRVIVFCQYRDTVIEAFNMAKAFEPLMRPTPFMGQATTGKMSHGITQKQQLQVMEKFRSGCFNILVSTCVGEEGLDIGEVDLIICFDAHTSPVRLMQRIGRTGRKREGRIIMLITDGTELQRYKRSLHQQDTVSKHIIDSQMVLCPNSPRMVPKGLNPKCHELIIRVNEVNEDETDTVIKKGKRKTKTMDLKTLWTKSCDKFGESIKQRSEMIEHLGSALPYDREKECRDECTITAVMEPAFLYSIKKDELQDIFHHPTTQLPGNKNAVTQRLMMHHQWIPQSQKTFLVDHSSLTQDLKSLFNLIESKRQNLPQTQTAELAKKIDSANLEPQTKKRKRVAEGKGLQTTEAKRKKLQDASSLFDKTFKLPMGIPSSKVKKGDGSVKQSVAQDDRKNEDEIIIPVDVNVECNFMRPGCNVLDDLEEETRNCFKKVIELSNMTNFFVKSFKYQNCCYSEPAISCQKLHHLSVSVTDLLEPPLIPAVLNRLCTSYQEPVNDHFKCALKFTLVCNIDQFLSELPLSQEHKDIDKEFICGYGIKQSPLHEIKPPFASDTRSDIVVDIGAPNTSQESVECNPDAQIKSCSSSISPKKISDFKNADGLSVFAAHVSPLGDKIFTCSDISDSSPVLTQKTRKDPVCSTPKIGKKILFKIDSASPSSSNTSKLALESSNNGVKTGEQTKVESTVEEHDSELKDGLNFMFKLVPEEEEHLFSGIGSDSANEESVTQNEKQCKSQVCELSCRMDTDHIFGENKVGKLERESQNCISLSTDSGDSEICKKPCKKDIESFLRTSSSETESVLDRYVNVCQERKKSSAKVSQNKGIETDLTAHPKQYDTENGNTCEIYQNTASCSMQSSEESSSLDDDFVCNKQNNMKYQNTVSRKTAMTEGNQGISRREKHKQCKTTFAVDECSVSVTSLIISEDEELESNSEYEASFLNEIPSEDSDYMVGKYLESVRSPMKGRGQFKIPEIKRHNEIDTSSDTDDFNDTYAKDSFCVDEVEEESPHLAKRESGIETSERYVRNGRRKLFQKSSKRWRRITDCHDSNTDETD